MTRTHTAAGVAEALGLDPGDVLTVLRSLDEQFDADALDDEVLEELYGVLDGPECARSVPEGFLAPDFRLTDEWRSLGPDDDDPRHV